MLESSKQHHTEQGNMPQQAKLIEQQLPMHAGQSNGEITAPGSDTLEAISSLAVAETVRQEPMSERDMDSKAEALDWILDGVRGEVVLLDKYTGTITHELTERYIEARNQYHEVHGNAKGMFHEIGASLHAATTVGNETDRRMLQQLATRILPAVEQGSVIEQEIIAVATDAAAKARTVLEHADWNKIIKTYIENQGYRYLDETIEYMNPSMTLTDYMQAMSAYGSLTELLSETKSHGFIPAEQMSRQIPESWELNPTMAVDAAQWSSNMLEAGSYLNSDRADFIGDNVHRIHVSTLAEMASTLGIEPGDGRLPDVPPRIAAALETHIAAEQRAFEAADEAYIQERLAELPRQLTVVNGELLATALKIPDPQEWVTRALAKIPKLFGQGVTTIKFMRDSDAPRMTDANNNQYTYAGSMNLSTGQMTIYLNTFTMILDRLLEKPEQAGNATKAHLASIGENIKHEQAHIGSTYLPASVLSAWHKAIEEDPTHISDYVTRLRQGTTLNAAGTPIDCNKEDLADSVVMYTNNPYALQTTGKGRRFDVLNGYMQVH